jgi:signal transduction histidine kinase
MAGSATPLPATPPLQDARASCAWLTVLTVLLAWPDPPPLLAAMVRPAYFGLLCWFFWRTTQRSPELDGQAMRLVQLGFLVLGVGYTLGALVHIAGLEARHAAFAYLRSVCERGAWFLLGTTLLAYGLMLWLPQVLASHRILREHNARQRGELADAAQARTQLERRLVDADRTSMLGELAATIAHDLRNPLTIVKGTAESLCRRPRSVAEVAEHTAVIRRSIDRADQTIQALIDLARPRAVTLRELDAADAWRCVGELLAVEARRRQVAMHIVAPPRTTLLGDHTLLVQALLNLALNAVQASPADTTVELSARRLRRGRLDGVLFAIADRGSGLPPLRADGGLPPFFTTKPGGTGLGLASCRRIAAEAGGTLRLQRRHRGGTRAWLLLPLRPPASPTTTPSPVATATADTPCPAISC